MNDLGLTIFDVGVILIVGTSALLSLMRGGVREIFNLASWIGALAVASYAFSQFRPMVLDAVHNDLIADIGTGFLVFFIPLVVFKLIGGAIANAISRSALGPIDRLLGLVFGFARGALIVCAGYLVATELMPREQFPDWVTGARTLPQVEEGTAWLAQYVPDDLMARSQEAVNTTLERARDSGTGTTGTGLPAN
ncbi:MAG: CvpA family protein [Geminicoccaceae bacterium]|nr:CvpA family protein [Geminicoccaceae bacterium]MCB9942903.1 CvpA family protein [Geminicoccaceae bacterium]